MLQRVKRDIFSVTQLCQMIKDVAIAPAGRAGG